MTRSLRRRRHVVAALTVLGLCLGLAACSDGASESDGASSLHTASNGDTFNDADVAFAEQMIPHHAQAIQLVTLTDARDLDPAVDALAEGIRSAQTPEVETMVDWLTSWGKDIPATSNDHVHGGHDMGELSAPPGSDDMPGMVSGEQMQQLVDASDATFQDLWLQTMRAHHLGAIEMAEAEAADGAFPEAVALAKAIASTQQGEVDQIDALLGR